MRRQRPWPSTALPRCSVVLPMAVCSCSVVTATPPSIRFPAISSMRGCSGFMVVLRRLFRRLLPVRCLGADFGALVWLGLLAFRLWGRVRGVWGVFLLGKNNSLRSDIFFPARKTPHTPLPTGSRGIGRFKDTDQGKDCVG